ncbi:MAG: lysylphosphatidylglycerol synthase transmembrane domain-containing protein [Infirmifilum sp.]
MNDVAKRWIRKHVIYVVQAIFIIALGLYIIQDFKLGEFIQTLTQIDKQFILYLVIFEILYYFLHALSYWFLTYKRFRLKLREAIGGTMLAWLVDLILPSAFIEGDIVRIVFLRQYGDWASAISYNLFFRFLLNTTLALFIMITAVLAVNLSTSIMNYLLIYGITVLLAFLSAALIAVFIFDANRTLRFARWLIEKLPVKRKEALERETEKFLQYVSDTARDFSPYSPNLWAAVFSLMGQWISGVLTPYYSLRSIGVNINPILIGPGYTILTIFSLASIGVPFMVGSVDVALITLYLLLGVPKEKAVAAAFLGRGITILVTLSMIYPIGLYYGKKLFSKKNFEGLKETIRSIVKQYGFSLPLFF